MSYVNLLNTNDYTDDIYCDTVTANNISSVYNITTSADIVAGNISTTDNINVGGNLVVSDNITTSADISAVNVNASGNITTTADISAVNVNASGNITTTADISANDITASGGITTTNLAATSVGTTSLTSDTILANISINTSSLSVTDKLHAHSARFNDSLYIATNTTIFGTTLLTVEPEKKFSIRYDIGAITVDLTLPTVSDFFALNTHLYSTDYVGYSFDIIFQNYSYNTTVNILNSSDGSFYKHLCGPSGGSSEYTYIRLPNPTDTTGKTCTYLKIRCTILSLTSIVIYC